MHRVLHFVSGYPQYIQSMFYKLRHIIFDTGLQLKETLKYKTIIYSRKENNKNNHICYINLKSTHLELGFFTGEKLDFIPGMLETKWRSDFKIMKIYSSEEIKDSIIKDFLMKCAD